MPGELDGEQVRVEWVVVPARAERRDRFLGELGDFARAPDPAISVA